MILYIICISQADKSSTFLGCRSIVHVFPSSLSAPYSVGHTPWFACAACIRTILCGAHFSVCKSASYEPDSYGGSALRLCSLLPRSNVRSSRCKTRWFCLSPGCLLTGDRSRFLSTKKNLLLYRPCIVFHFSPSPILRHDETSKFENSKNLHLRLLPSSSRCEKTYMQLLCSAVD